MRRIDADALKEAVCNFVHEEDDYVPCPNQITSCLWSKVRVCDFNRIIDNQPTIEAEPKWIPVKMRPMDSEEREYWEDQFGEKLEDENAVTFDCPMPEDGQEILVSCRKWISMDKCEIDGGCYGLDYNGDWEDVIAWMPLPEPYKETEKDG